MRRAYNHVSVLLVCVAVVAASASCAAAPQPPRINVALAQLRAAQLDEADGFYSRTLRAAGVAYRGGEIDADAVASVKEAGEVLYEALTIAHLEHKLYLAGGDNLSTYDAAFAKVKTARVNLGLVAQKAGVVDGNP